ncbi:MAG: DUF350 domain-containing protein [Polyangiaceae bacterium]
MRNETVYTLAFASAVTTALLVLLRLLERTFAPDHRLKSDLERGDVPFAILHAGDVLAVFLVSASVVANCVHRESVGMDVAWSAAFGIVATSLYYGTSRLGMRALFQKSLVGTELARGNLAAGVTAAAHAIATGILVARAIGGNDLPSLGLSLVFFAIAQASLHVLVALFRWLTPYDDAEEILGGNLAAAVSYSGVTVAVAILVGHAVEGPFTGWTSSLTGYAIALGYGVSLYVVRQFVVPMVLLGAPPTLRRGVLDRGIATDRDVGKAVLEAVAYLATAFLVVRIG